MTSLSPEIRSIDGYAARFVDEEARRIWERFKGWKFERGGREA